MTHRIITLIACGLLIVQTSDAQSRRRTTNRRVSTKDVAAQLQQDSAKAEQLFDAYQFEEAADVWETIIEKAQKAKRSATAYQQRMAKARIGENMLQATERIVMVDSFVVNKSDFLSVLRLSQGCGSIRTYADVFGQAEKSDNGALGSTVYINEFQDKMIYSYPNAQGRNRLLSRDHVGENWSSSMPLAGLSNEEDSTEQQAFPYMLSDGTTLYYAANNENSLGGYDIYVTRYNTDTKQYLRPENIGMPFNSPANDYLYVIDETNQLGWFASDRYQPEGKVCVYVFVPTETRDTYSIDEDNADSIRGVAQIHHIAASQNDRKAVMQAQQRLQNASVQKAQASSTDFIFYVTKGVKYTSLSQFKSQKAQQMAQKWQATTAQRATLIATLKENRKAYGEGNKNLKNTILKEEQQLEQLDEAIRTLENEIRTTENIQ